MPKNKSGTNTNNQLQLETAQVTVSMIFFQEHDKLLRENHELKAQLATIDRRESHVTGERDQLRLILLEKDKTIEELKKENDELKKENEVLKIRITQLEHNVEELTNENRRKNQQQLVKTFLVALQGVNEWCEVENHSHEPYKTYMKNIRLSRNGCSHYIAKDDSEGLKEYKCRYILTKIKELSEVTSLLNKRAKFDNFTNQMIDYLKNIPETYHPTEEEEEDVENWWNDQI